MASPIGKFCIVRCRDAGVHCGFVESVNGRTVEIREDRIIHRWDSDWCWTLNEMVNRGAPEDTRISAPIELNYVLDACEIKVVTNPEAIEKLRVSKWEIDD